MRKGGIVIILFILGRKDGCDIYYVNNGVVSVQSLTCSSKHVIFELGKLFHRPMKATMRLIRGKYGYHQKIPCLIEMNHTLLFPLQSMENKECCWINYYCIKDIKLVDNATEISFNDYTLLQANDLNFTWKFNTNRRVIVKQMLRCKNIHESYSESIKMLNSRI